MKDIELGRNAASFVLFVFNLRCIHILLAPTFPEEQNLAYEFGISSTKLKKVAAAM